MNETGMQKTGRGYGCDEKLFEILVSKSVMMRPLVRTKRRLVEINPLNAELNPICHLLALLGTHHILHVSRIRVKMVFKEVRSIYILPHQSSKDVSVG